jgi:hypothetical protein
MAIADLCLVVDGVDLNQMDWVGTGAGSRRMARSTLTSNTAWTA